MLIAHSMAENGLLTKRGIECVKINEEKFHYRKKIK
jgi:hypothetical protein